MCLANINSNATLHIHTPGGQSIIPIKTDCWAPLLPPAKVSTNTVRIKNIFLEVMAIALVTSVIIISVTALSQALFWTSIAVGAIALAVLLSYGIYKANEAYKVFALKLIKEKFELLEKNTAEIIQETISQTVSTQKISEMQSICQYLTRVNNIPDVVKKAVQHYQNVLTLLNYIAYAQSNLKIEESIPHVNDATNPYYAAVKLNFTYYFQVIENPENKSQMQALTQPALSATLERLNKTLRARILKMFDQPLSKFKKAIMDVLNGMNNQDALPNIKELLEIFNIIKFSNEISEKIGSLNQKSQEVKKSDPPADNLQAFQSRIISAISLLAAKTFIESCRQAKDKDLISEKNTIFELKLHDIITEAGNKLSKLIQSQPHINYILIKIFQAEMKNLESPVDIDALLSEGEIQKITAEIPKIEKALLSCKRRWRFRIKKEWILEYRKIRAQRRNQLSDPAAENSRLEKAGFTAKINSILNFTDDRVIPLGRALERIQMYKPTHYAYTHNQAQYSTVITDLIRGLTRLFKPGKYLPFSPHFRIPELVPKVDNVEAFFKNNPQTHDHTPHIRDQLLCVDAYFWNQAQGESAINFFVRNTSAFNLVLPLSTTILTQYLPDQKICAQIAARVNQISIQKQSESCWGALNVICIPKANEQDPKRRISYRSLAYGVKCARYPDSEHIAILEEHQNDKPRDGYHTAYRLLTSGLCRTPGIRSFRFSTLTPEKRKYYREAIRQIALETYVYARIYKLQAKPSEAELKVLTEDIQKLVKQKDFDKTTLQSLLKAKSTMINVNID